MQQVLSKNIMGNVVLRKKAFDLSKRKVSTLVYPTKFDDKKVVSPGHVTMKLDSSEMKYMQEKHPDHSITQSGFVGFGPDERSSLKSQFVDVDLAGQKRKVGSLIKTLKPDSNRNMKKIYGDPEKTIDHGTLNPGQLEKLVKEHDHIQRLVKYYRTDITSGNGFPGTEYEDKRTINCVGGHNMLGTVLGMKPDEKLNTMPQERGESVKNFKVNSDENE